MRSAISFAAALGVAASLLVLPRTMAVAGDAPTLKVEAVLPKGSGTTHYADELRLSVGDSASLVLKTDPGGKLIPVPGPQYKIDDSHVLLLGWSSYGGGMQTLHAMLVRIENGGVTLQRELTLTAARMAAPLIVRRNGPNEFLLGIGEPGARLHNEGDWSLVLGRATDERLDIGQIRKLRFVADKKSADDVVYAPPVQSARFPARLTWLSVSAGGFALLTGGR